MTTPNNPIPPRRDPVAEFDKREASKARTLTVVRWLFIAALCAGALYCGYTDPDVRTGTTEPWQAWIFVAFVLAIAWFFFRPRKR
jgi:hypothetical protein